MLSDTFFSLSPSPILVLDKAGCLLEANPAARAIFGLSAEITGPLPLAAFCHPDDQAQLAMALGRLAHGEEILFEPCRFVMETGGFRRFQWHARPFAQEEKALAVGHDITAVWMGQTDLRANLVQLAEGERMAGLGSWSLDIRTGQRCWSDGFYLLLGLTPGSMEPSFETLNAFLTPPARRQVEDAVDRVLTGGTPVELQYAIVRRCGTERILQARLKPLLDGEGRVIGYMGTALDVTEEQTVRRALADSERRYKALMEHASDATLVVNAEWRFIDANRRAIELLGYSKEELMQMSPPDVLPPEDHEAMREAFREMNETGTSLHEYLALARDGRLIPVEVAGTRIPCGDSHVFLGSLRDVSQRKSREAELWQRSEELEAMFSNLHVCIAILDREFNFLRVNTAYAETMGSPAESFIGRNHFALYPHAENEKLFRNSVKAGVSLSVFARPFENPPGVITYWDWTLTPFRDTGGRVQGLVFALIDVTDREHQRQSAERVWQRAQAELEQRVHDRTSELESANRELEAFSYSVSHDLRSPLRAINGFSEALQEDCAEELSETGRNHLNRITSATLRMSELIDGLLGLSRVYRTELQTSRIDLSKLARDIARDLREGDPVRVVEFEIEPNLAVSGDETLLRLLLLNLLGNAWKFTQKRQHARILFGRLHREGRELFCVRDNGAGFEAQYAGKLFQPFQRLHREEEFRGTGIGLATVRRIVHRHGGEVWAEGIPGEGATFFFTLAAAISPEPAAIPRHASQGSNHKH